MHIAFESHKHKLQTPKVANPNHKLRNEVGRERRGRHISEEALAMSELPEERALEDYDAAGNQSESQMLSLEPEIWAGFARSSLVLMRKPDCVLR